VSEVLERMASLGIGRLPVVADNDPTRLVGLFRREDAVRAYHVALGREVEHEMGRSRLQARVDPGTEFREVPIPRGSFADGRTLSEAPIPEASIVVAVRRGRQVIVPRGDTVLKAGDTLAVFGRPDATDRLAERLGSSQPTADDERQDLGSVRFFDIEIPTGSVADGRELRELAVPSGCTVVSIRRKDDVIIPHGDTLLIAGDVLTVFSQPGARGELAERLRTTSDEGS
jgi:Trk K+ transport system NAD-binding subunit